MYGGSFTKKFVRSSKSIPTGTLMKKTHLHEKLSVIHPPNHGPMVGATTTASPYTANAMPRFSSENVSFRIACWLGCSPPPPTPCRIRKITSTPRLGANPHKNELTHNNATHDM